MNQNVLTFTAPTGQPIRTALIHGEPWFVAADVCRALGLNADHTTKIGGVFKDDEVRTVRREQTLSDGVSSSLLFTGTAGRLRILSESGLYKLVMRSDKKEALVFQDWVTREVLPSIRKTGGYQLADHGRTEMPLPADLAVAIQQLAAAQRELADRVVVALDEFPLTAAIVESLPYLRITAVNDRLFDMKPANVWYMWNTIREDVKAQNPKLNIDDVKLHTLRHTCLTRLLRGGFPLHKVSIWAGHADVKITMDRYTKVNSGELLEGAGILNRASAGSHLKVVSA